MNGRIDKDTWISKLELRIQQYRYFIENTNQIFKAIDLMVSALKQGNKILVFGNGGSAVQASHFAAELVNKFYFQRRGLSSIALTTDPACITSIANDMSFEHIFSRQLEALANPGDIAIGLTTSGKSPNVINAFKLASQMDLKTIAVCGQNTDSLVTPELAIDIIASVPCSDTPVVQELHLFILHTWAEFIEKELCGGTQ